MMRIASAARLEAQPSREKSLNQTCQAGMRKGSHRHFAFR
jgi:hypothetical protein